jgi:hypothetical protein
MIANINKLTEVDKKRVSYLIRDSIKGILGYNKRNKEGKGEH